MKIPLSILLIIPMCLLAASSGLHIRSLPIDILAQIGFVVLLGLAFFGGKEQPAEEGKMAAGEEVGEFDAFAGGYPVPPIGDQVLPEFAQVLTGDQDLAPDKSPNEQPSKEGSEA